MWKKILLAVIALPLLLGLFLWLVQPVWWQAMKAEWLTEFNAERAEAAARWRNEGLAFGRLNDQQTCLEQTLTNFDGCTGFECTVNHGRFLKAPSTGRNLLKMTSPGRRMPAGRVISAVKVAAC